MIITDYNKMSLEELEVIHNFIGLSFVISDGEIAGTEKIPATDRKSEQG